MADAIHPFVIRVSDADLSNLRERLWRTRWPERQTVDDWSQGIPLAVVQELCEYWADRYDWLPTEDRLSRLGQHRTEIDGLGIHFLHVRSPHPDAVPLILTHGWPGSVIEFLKVIGPLTDPSTHGGDPADAFHVVCPSLPGYGFSDKPSHTGWGVEHVADAWAVLMARLGYQRYGAQGGDWGAAVTNCIGQRDGDHVVGIHLSGDLFSIVSRDDLLDNVMLYWLPAVGASSARLYWESLRALNQDPVPVPVGCSQYPKEIYRASRRWARQRYPDQRFTAYIEDRRRKPQKDVLTELAMATFRNGSTPDVTDIANLATFLFIAGHETTVRLLASSLQLLAEQPQLQTMLRDNREHIPNFVGSSILAGQSA